MPASRSPRGRLLAALAFVPQLALAQIAGENVNMVSGVQWPGGDPYLQRQNEPSIAVSSWTGEHLLAAANDYRTVDIPNPNSPDETGDAWLGVFKSFNAGQSWQSTLLPGYPQDTSAAGMGSPLHGFTTGADPVVRSGTNGMFYLTGIAFNRGTNQGRVFVARFQDRNNKENGNVPAGTDPLPYLGAIAIETGGGTVFIDKPWLAVDAPRAGALSCTVPGSQQSFPGGMVYVVYHRFFGAFGTAPASSDVMLTRSRDCGSTWSAPVKLNDASSKLNQGATLAVDPRSGDVYVAWRRFASGTQTDAVMAVRSFSAGAKFTRPRLVSSLVHFDQDGARTRFRMESLPTIAISASGSSSWAHLAWASRPAAGADARVVVSSAMVYPPPSSGDERDDDCHGWSTPAPADSTPLRDDFGNTLSRGHQFMPQLSFSQGRLVLVYYDTRLDHVWSYFKPNDPFALDAQGRLYTRQLGPVGELVGAPDLVHTPALDEAGLTQTRHTVDVRLASAAPGPSPSFATTPVSQAPVGTRGDEVPGLSVPGFAGSIPVVDAQGKILLLQQLQANPPNLPMFAQGTVPFMGDYIDIQGRAFVPTSGGGWAFNTAPSPAPVFHAVWTSNQDVRPPPDGDWSRYTPPGGGGTSVFDPNLPPRPACVTGYEGTRNQNIYSSRISEGLVVSSPQNAKPLGSGPAQTRGFVVVVQNATARERAVRISLTVPAGVHASFRNDGVMLQTFDVTVGARASVQRTLFVYLDGSSDSAASIAVNVAEVVDDPGCLGNLPPTCAPVAGGLSGFVTLNPPGSVVPLLQPDLVADPLASGEVYKAVVTALNVTNPNVSTPNVTSLNVTNPNVTNLNVTNPNVTNPNVTNLNVTNPNVTNLNVTNPNVTNLNVTNLNVTNPNVTNLNVTNLNVTNPNVTNAPLSDALYQVTNTSNTTHSFRVVVVGNPGQLAGAVQLIVSTTYTTPLGLNCQLVEEPHSAIVANVGDVRPFMVPASGAVDPNIPDPGIGNATVSLAPGASAQITLRGAFSDLAMSQLAGQVAPAVVPHAGGPAAIALLVATDGSTLPAPRVGVPYGANLQAVGGTPPYTWTVASGALPPGLSLAPSGLLGGTPRGAGAFSAVLAVADAAGGSAQRALALQVGAGPATLGLSVVPASPVFGQPVALTATVSASAPAGGVAAPSGSVTLLDGSTTLGTVALSGADGTASAALVLPAGSLAVGSHLFAARFAGDGNYGPSSVTSPSATPVARAQTASGLSSSANPSPYGSPVTFTVAVGVLPPGAGAPGGTVSFADGAAPLGTAPLDASGRASLTVPALDTGSHLVGASYSGDGSFAASSASLAQLVVPAPTTTAVAAAPDPATFGQPVDVAVQVASSGGTPDGSVTVFDGASLLGAPQLVGGQADLPVSLPGGTHQLSASYGGSTHFAGSSSAPYALQVNPAATATALAAAPNPSSAGQAVTFTAAVTSAAGVPAGLVTFADGPTALGTAAVDPITGRASFATSGLSAGSHTVTASYAPNPGDGSFAPSTAALVQTVSSAYQFVGFLPPLATAGSASSPSSSGNQSLAIIPIQWELEDIRGTYLHKLSAIRSLVSVANSTCAGAPPAGARTQQLYPPPTSKAATILIIGDYYVYGWVKSGAGGLGCYNLVLTLDDGTQKATIVKLK